LIGAHLLGRLLSHGHDVYAVTRGAPPPAAPSGLHWISLDLTAASLPQLPTRVDVIVHLAQSPHYRSFPEHALDVFEVNVASTARLLDWARKCGARHFILASSGGVASATVPVSHYAASKQCAELLAGSYSRCFAVLILRFFFVYGRGQKPWMLVPRLVTTVQTGSEVALAGADGPRLNPVFVGDAVGGIMRAIERTATGTIDIAGGQVLSVRAMTEIIAGQLRMPARYRADDAAASHDLIGNIARMSSELAAPEWTFERGIADMLNVQGTAAP
jgi:nucleoside-diphosphate-sugar epimerase